jgi:hypothetical protein
MKGADPGQEWRSCGRVTSPPVNETMSLEREPPVGRGEREPAARLENTPDFSERLVEFFDMLKHLDGCDQVKDAVRIAELCGGHLTDGNAVSDGTVLNPFGEQCKPVRLDVNRIDAVEAVSQASGVGAVATADVQQPITVKISPKSKSIKTLPYASLAECARLPQTERVMH